MIFGIKLALIIHILIHMLYAVINGQLIHAEYNDI